MIVNEPVIYLRMTGIALEGTYSLTHSLTHSLTYFLTRYLEVSLSLLRLNKGGVESDDENASPPALTGCSSLTYSLAYLLTHSSI